MGSAELAAVKKQVKAANRIINWWHRMEASTNETLSTTFIQKGGMIHTLETSTAVLEYIIKNNDTYVPPGMDEV